MEDRLTDLAMQPIEERTHPNFKTLCLILLVIVRKNFLGKVLQMLVPQTITLREWSIGYKQDDTISSKKDFNLVETTTLNPTNAVVD